MTRFQRRRLATGITQKDIARRLSADPSTVSKWESGDAIPAPHFFPKLARIFRITPDEVVDLFAPQPEPAPSAA
jgi:transcriptional regulator with XRE-family HTH domain